MAAQLALADGPKDNLIENVRPVPPPGVPVPPADKAEIEKGLGLLAGDIHGLKELLKGKPALLELLPDVEIYHKAADWALRYNEFFKTNEIAIAKAAIVSGRARAQALREGKTPWLTTNGPVLRAYKSKIDGSIQPYGLVLPPGIDPKGAHKYRVDFWFHGRGETLSELNFIADRSRNPGQFTPTNTIVLHLYNRFCNPARLAGETDVLESFEQVKKYYKTDENRIVVRGFSMGGASCWGFAVHYPGVWAAAAPGAGFSETADFLKVYQNESLKPAWWEEKLWRMYDATDSALNIFNIPTVAYSGELDGQKQAADMMEKAMAKEGLKLTHIIGPGTKHAYEPNAKKEVDRRIDEIAAKGRNPVPREIKYVAYTLKYNRCFWITLDGLEQHWEQGRVEATIDDNGNLFGVRTANLSALSLNFEAGQYPGTAGRAGKAAIDGQVVDLPAAAADKSLTVHFRKSGKKWTVAKEIPSGLVKKHDLQGPIDDAFMDSFVMVKPTGKPLNDKAGAWTQKEMAHAVQEWRHQFRGDAIVKDDSAITDADIASSNLVLWGDPQSNKVLAKIADKLPVKWNASAVKIGSQSFPAASNVAVMIYPNPLNPKRYVVINSGFTYREYDYLNNARQTPKLPDWAVVDIDKPMTSRAPGGIVTAGFFGEQWEVKPANTR